MAQRKTCKDVDIIWNVRVHIEPMAFLVYIGLFCGRIGLCWYTNTHRTHMYTHRTHIYTHRTHTYVDADRVWNLCAHRADGFVGVWIHRAHRANLDPPGAHSAEASVRLMGWLRLVGSLKV